MDPKIINFEISNLENLKWDGSSTYSILTDCTSEASALSRNECFQYARPGQPAQPAGHLELRLYIGDLATLFLVVKNDAKTMILKRNS